MRRILATDVEAVSYTHLTGGKKSGSLLTDYIKVNLLRKAMITYI